MDAVFVSTEDSFEYVSSDHGNAAFKNTHGFRIADKVSFTFCLFNNKFYIETNWVLVIPNIGQNYN